MDEAERQTLLLALEAARNYRMNAINRITNLLKDAGMTDDEIVAALAAELKKRGEL